MAALLDRARHGEEKQQASNITDYLQMGVIIGSSHTLAPQMIRPAGTVDSCGASYKVEQWKP